ncbi:MAG: hypothetical protein LBG87_04665 [Spirochaetaceae bacterium]|nr:hypothetical protein [Spirochaetaceae bacterium]
MSYETDYLYDGMFGLGAEYSFLFGEKEIPEKKVSRYGMITPEMCAEYSPFSNQLRLQTGLNLGKLFIGFLMFYDYYVGAAGIFLRDFNHDVNALGVAPEIGFEVLFFSFQVRYEWYTDYRYNRVAVTFGFPLYQLLIFFSIL